MPYRNACITRPSHQAEQNDKPDLPNSLSSFPAFLQHCAAALNAKSLDLVQWNASNQCLVKRTSVPENSETNLSTAQLSQIVDSLRHHLSEFPSQADSPILLSMKDRTLLNDTRLTSSTLNQSDCAKLPEHLHPTYVYGCFVRDHPPNFDYIIISLPHPLLPHQEPYLAGHVLALRQHMAMEEELQRQTAKAMLLEQVIQWTSHQVRHPLSLIEMYVDILMMAPTHDPVTSFVTQLYDAVIHLGEHIQRLADYGLRKTFQPEHHSLHSIWLESVRRVHPWAEQKQVRLINHSDPVELWCDRWQISQVFDNLLHNAICFSPEGGVITCHWQRCQGDVVIEITDQGMGVLESDLQKVFAPFYSRRDGGTGIGLAMVRKIVLDHKGQCWVQNLPDGGAKFSFTLKLCDEYWEL